MVGRSAVASHRYDPHKRDPLFTQAHHSALWELTVLLHHYHPSVTHWTSLLLSHQPIHYAGDPLTDFTPAAFLDRFVFKNPKQTADGSRTGRHLQRKTTTAATAANGVLVSSSEFLRKKEKDVREDERFYWLYFKEKQRRESEGVGRAKKRKEKGEEVEDEEAAMDEFADRIMEAELAKTDKRGEVDEDELLKALEEAEEEEGEEGEAGEEEDEGEELTEDMLAEMDGMKGLDGLDEDELDDSVEMDEDEDADAAAEAEAAAELGLDDDDEDEEGDVDKPTFSDEGSDDEEAAEEEVEEEASNRTKKKRRMDGVKRVSGLGSESVFASAEEFADLLAEGADDSVQHRKEKMREFTHDRVDLGGRRGKSGGGGRGRGGRGRGGGKRRK